MAVQHAYVEDHHKTSHSPLIIIRFFPFNFCLYQNTVKTISLIDKFALARDLKQQLTITPSSTTAHPFLSNPSPTPFHGTSLSYKLDLEEARLIQSGFFYMHCRGTKGINHSCGTSSFAANHSHIKALTIILGTLGPLNRALSIVLNLWEIMERVIRALCSKL